MIKNTNTEKKPTYNTVGFRITTHSDDPWSNYNIPTRNAEEKTTINIAYAETRTMDGGCLDEY